ncbi:MAG: acyltransferase family protein [Holdemanella sp.]|nr:acyltransferase family protein [Holdemanella sp.]
MIGKKRYVSIDIAKYVAVLLVICVHTFPLVEISSLLNTYWIQTICRLAIPFFFASAGFFFFRKWDEDPEVNKRNLIRFEKRVLKLYLIWTVIYLPYTIWDYAKAGFSVLSIVSYLRDFLLNGSYYHLWVLPTIMLAMPLVSMMYQRFGLLNTLKTCLIAYIIGYFINVYGPVWEQVPVVSFIYEFFMKAFATSRNGIFFGPIFIGIGLLLSRTRRLPKQWIISGFLVSFILLVLEVTLYRLFGILRDITSMYITLIPAVYFLMNWLLSMNIPDKQRYRELNKEASLIYMSHILFAKVLINLFPRANLVVYFITLALSQLFATLVITNKKQFPILEHLL